MPWIAVDQLGHQLSGREVPHEALRNALAHRLDYAALPASVGEFSTHWFTDQHRGGANGDCLLPVSGRVGVPRIWSPVSCLVLVI